MGNLDKLQARKGSPIVERRYLIPFALVTTLFLSWALAASLNDVLIRQFQKALDLSRTQSSLIQLAFYLGYFCAALPAGLLIRRIGYKGTIIAGLSCYAIGAFLFVPAADIQRYGLFLAALYIIAFGLAFLETAANPYVSILGAPETASARLNLAQGFYGIGAIMGPIVGGLFIFSGADVDKARLASMSPAAVASYRTAEAAAVKGPYAVIGLLVCVLGLIISRTSFPKIERPLAERKVQRRMASVLRYPRVVWAVVALFFYVGAQVGIWSFFIDFTRAEAPHLNDRTVAFLLSASLGLLMIGRFGGAWIQRHISPARSLAFCAVADVALCAVAAGVSGVPAVASLWLTSLFMSIMFPTIFALGVADLGEETEAASSFLIMAIIGGAVIPPLMGLASDQIGGIHHVMILPAICFAIIGAFALRANRPGGAIA